jgi:hypothetical protein
MMMPKRRFGFWFWVAMVAIVTNLPLINFVLHLLQQGLHLVGLH